MNLFPDLARQQEDVRAVEPQRRRRSALTAHSKVTWGLFSFQLPYFTPQP
jgi:hypothetical protein